MFLTLKFSLLINYKINVFVFKNLIVLIQRISALQVGLSWQCCRL